MQTNLLEKFLSRKGQIVTITMRRPLKLRKEYKGKLAFKTVKMQARAGVAYDNMAAVQSKRESGELPAENAGLPWGEWEIFPHVIRHNGAKYLRFSSFPSSNRAEIQFEVDGQAVDREVVAPLCLASEFTEKESLDVFNVKEDNILDIA